MNRRTFLSTAASLLPLAGAQTRATRPNIVVILADDMGFSDIGCYGSEVQTPNIDGLARRGVRFTQFYNTARCCPTRAALLTGLYSHQAGVGHMVADWDKPGYRGTLNENCATIAELLRDSGYRCYVSGKWHVTRPEVKRNWPLQRGFHDAFGTMAGGGNYFYPHQLFRGNEFVEPVEGIYYTDAITTHAVQFVEQHRKQHAASPFFLYVPYTAPHWPLHALEPEIAKYRGIYREGWDELRRQRHKRQRDLEIMPSNSELSPRDGTVPPWTDAPDKEWEVERVSVYAAQIDRMDQGIGRILKQLPDNTLVLFLSDNGSSAEIVKQTPANYRHTPFEMRGGNTPSIKPGPRETFQSCGPSWAQVSNTPFRRYKSTVYEGGIATPLIAAWTGRVRSPGSFDRAPGHVIDILPTCLDAAGASYPATLGGRTLTPVEGKSLLPALAGRKRNAHSALFWEHEGNQAIRRSNWKLVRAHRGAWELYDLAADRSELHDLAARRPDMVQQLTAEYERWMQRANVLPWDDARPKRP